MAKKPNNKIVTMTKAKFKELYFKLTEKELADRLGITQPGVVYWATKLGFKKTRTQHVRIQD